MASAYDNARKRLALIEQEMQEIRHFLAMYERFDKGTDGAQTEPQSGKPGEENSDPAGALKPVKNSGPARVTRRARPAEIAEIIERVIREVGFPMTRGQIVQALEARDVELPVDDKARYVGTIIWRHKSMFENIEGRGYWLRGESLPKVEISDLGQPPLAALAPAPQYQNDRLDRLNPLDALEAEMDKLLNRR